jgi:hypothetical protein
MCSLKSDFSEMSTQLHVTKEVLNKCTLEVFVSLLRNCTNTTLLCEQGRSLSVLVCAPGTNKQIEICT